MRCPTCKADNQTGSFVCHSCLRPLPLEEGGAVPMTVETGAPRPSARYVQQPSEWTMPLQVTVAVYLILSAVVSVLALVLGQDAFTRAFVLTATARGSNLSIDQLTQTAHLSYAGVLVVAVFVAVLKAMLAAGGFMRWSWVYIVDMVLLALSALSTLGTLVLIPSFATSGALLGQEVIPLVLDVAGLCLFTWMAVAINRYGIWACRKIPVAT
jgi:hypothetical protein